MAEVMCVILSTARLGFPGNGTVEHGKKSYAGAKQVRQPQGWRGLLGAWCFFVRLSSDTKPPAPGALPR